MRDPCAREFAASWIAAWNAHDMEAILSHHAEDIEFRSPVARALTGDGRVRGLADLRAYWTRGLSLNGGLNFHLLDVLRGDGFLTLLYNNARMHSVAETFEFDGSGRVIRASVCYGAAADSSPDVEPHPQVNDAGE